jgi:hypothetical protein
MNIQTLFYYFSLLCGNKYQAIVGIRFVIDIRS